MTKIRIRRAAVIGAGVMGAGIAQVFIEHGLRVRLFSRRSTTLRAAVQDIKKRQSMLVRNGLLSPKDAEKAQGRLEPTTSLPDAIHDVQFVNENIRENLEEKRALFQTLSDSLPSDAILSTNTSSLSLSSIAPAVRHPARFVGLHWMNPAYLMPIVEVIRGPKTPDSTMESVCDLARKVGRSPIVLNQEVPGYVINRLQYALFREAFALVERGVVSAADVDKALRDGLGLRWAVLGPFEHMDLSGLDTVLSVSSELFKDLHTDVGAPELLEKLVAAGNLGVKTGGGFHGLSRKTLQRRARKRDHDIIAMLSDRGRQKRKLEISRNAKPDQAVD